MKSRELTAIVLAAGLSRRMGIDKLMLPIDGKPMAQLIMDKIRSLSWHQKIIVSSGEKIYTQARNYGFLSLLNPHPEQGQSSSIRMAILHSSPNTDGYMFFVADQPYLSTKSIQAMKDAFDQFPDCIVRARYHGTTGNPVIFPSSYREEFFELRGDEGGKKLISAAPDRVRYVDIEDPSEGLDIDTPAEYELMKDRKVRNHDE